MAKVKMKVGIRYNQKRVAIGDEITVSDSVAKRWAAQGIAEMTDPADKAGGDDLSTQDTSQPKKQTSTSTEK